MLIFLPLFLSLLIIISLYPLFLDYFPSPTRIMHEIQFALLQLQQQSNLHPDQQSAVTTTTSGPLLPDAAATASSKKVPPPRPPRTKRPLLLPPQQQPLLEEVDEVKPRKHSSCHHCKLKTTVETKSVGCGTDYVLKKHPMTRANTAEQ